MQVNFLKNNPKYVGSIAEWMYREWGYLRGDSSADRYFKVISGRLNDDRTPLTVIVRTDREELLGFASLVDHDMEINRDLSPWMGGVFVVPDHRGQGIGRVVVSEVEQVAKDLGYSKLYLFTFDRERFYSRLSWRRIKEDFYLNSPVTVMSKDLV